MKMRLLDNEYMNDRPGKRFPAGAVLDVDDETANRWKKFKVAKDASATSKTFREESREELMAKLARMDREDAMATAVILGRGESPAVSGPAPDDDGYDPPVAEEKPRRGRPPGVRPTAEMQADQQADE